MKQGRQFSTLNLVLAMAALLHLPVAELTEGDPCTIQTLPGICTPYSKCTSLRMAIKSNLITKSNIPSCGLNAFEEVICCPTLARSSVSTMNRSERPAVSACREIEQNARLEIEPQIVNGDLADPGEFPHAVALGYPQMASGIQYSFRCGGSLISPRFVLTAAHCINTEESQPSIARMGTLNINVPDEATVDIAVKETYVHPNYKSTYDDIGLVELVEDAPITDTIRPVCLNTDTDAMILHKRRSVIGWGYINANQDTTNVLLKASVNEVDIGECNATYAAENLIRDGMLDRGILDTQICALDPRFQADACPGDSGGPLLVSVEPARRLYRVIGIVSGGVSCGSRIPGIYTRVSAYLDYIEKIVWPTAR